MTDPTIESAGSPQLQFGGTVLYVADVAATTDFYKRAFGLRLRFVDVTLGFAELDTGGSLLAVASESLGHTLMPSGDSRPADGRIAGVEIAFFTRDVAGAFDEAVKQGAFPVAAPRRMPWGLEVAYVRAPEGTLIGFSEPSQAVSCPHSGEASRSPRPDPLTV